MPTDLPMPNEPPASVLPTLTPEPRVSAVSTEPLSAMDSLPDSPFVP